MMKKLTILFMGLVILLFARTNIFGQAQVVPCQLNNPDQDTLRLFPERTNYRIEFIRTDDMGEKRGVGGEALYRELERRLGDRWDPIWETKDIPYVFYEILKGPDRIGWVFGANQGWPGADNSQLMYAFDLDGRIREFYYQKLPSLEKEKLQTKEFYAQFIGLTLEHFYVHEQFQNLAVKDSDILTLDMIARIQDPTQKEHEGFQKTLRGIKKVLVYLDDFKFGNKIKRNEVFEKVRYLKQNKDKIPLLSQDALSQIKKSFPDASRFVVDFVDLGYPVYVAYKDDAYKAPFVRGDILGYVSPVSLDTPEGKFTAIVAVGAQDKEKGKIVSLVINKTEFGQFKGLSLVHFYTKDVLTETDTIDEKIDRIAPISVIIEGKDMTTAALGTAKKALIIINEHYFHNFFKKDEIMRKMKDYLKAQKE